MKRIATWRSQSKPHVGANGHWFLRLWHPQSSVGANGHSPLHQQRNQGLIWKYRFLYNVLGFLLAFVLVFFLPHPAFSTQPSIPSTPPSTLNTQSSPDTEARQLYQQGRFQEAIASFQRALAYYESQGDRLRQAMIWGNLALAHQQLGEWETANGAIATSLQLVTAQDATVLAQVLDIQGHLQLEQGQAEAALSTWEQSTSLYQQLGDTTSVIQAQINQSRAMQALGLYRRAIALLTPLRQVLQPEPDSQLKAIALRNLGDALQVGGNLNDAQTMLQESLDIAKRMGDRESVSAAQFSLGNVARALGDPNQALTLYQQASTIASPTLRIQIQLNQLRLLISQKRDAEAQEIWQQVHSQLDTLPTSRTTVYARVNLASSLMQWQGGAIAPTEIAPILATAIQHAEQLGDRRAEAYAVGSLGTLYEQVRQWDNARSLTERALLLAQSTNAADISYRWQWQLGRILKTRAEAEQRGQYGPAIAAYEEAISTLKSLRTDLVAINPEVQFSFQESVEPIHRELVSLLLASNPDLPENSTNLEKARQVIESLQLAELENFFREACLDAQPVAIDQIDTQAAIVYSILLPDRLEVILRLPQRPLLHYSTPVSSERIDETTLRLRQRLTHRLFHPQLLALSQQLYDWLLRPAEADLQSSGINTLVFVLDGSLRGIPMSVLHDGEQYLIERYSVALTPGLQLLGPRPLATQQLSVLAAGLTEARQDFSALPGVTTELDQIRSTIPTQILLNESFTQSTLQEAIASNASPVVHLATHGQFSSKLEDTFILTWSDRITINQLNSLLRNTDINRQVPIELLVLSACKTAAGDRRAVLGLAGMAVQAGARSTVASLWSVDDRATSALMIRFYSELSQSRVTKAEALRRAQVAILSDPTFRGHPFFWSAFVLVGNWL